MKFYLSRINGYALAMFFLGMFANYKFNEKALIVAVPVFLIWLFTHDEITYQKRSEELREQHE